VTNQVTTLDPKIIKGDHASVLFFIFMPPCVGGTIAGDVSLAEAVVEVLGVMRQVLASIEELVELLAEPTSDNEN